MGGVPVCVLGAVEGLIGGVEIIPKPLLGNDLHLVIGLILVDNNKFVASVAGTEEPLVNQGTEELGEGLKVKIPRLVAQGVVVLLKMVDIQNFNGQAGPTPEGPVKGLLRVLVHPLSIGEVGEEVPPGLVQEELVLRLHLPLLTFDFLQVFPKANVVFQVEASLLRQAPGEGKVLGIDGEIGLLHALAPVVVDFVGHDFQHDICNAGLSD